MRIFLRCLDWNAERRFAARRSAFFSSSVSDPFVEEIFEFGVPLSLDADAEVALPFTALVVVDETVDEATLLAADVVSVPAMGMRITPPPLIR
jgi:hypothetical protein